MSSTESNTPFPLFRPDIRQNLHWCLFSLVSLRGLVPQYPFTLFWGEGSPTTIHYRKTGTLILTSLLETLGEFPLHINYQKESVPVFLGWPLGLGQARAAVSEALEQLRLYLRVAALMVSLQMLAGSQMHPLDADPSDPPPPQRFSPKNKPGQVTQRVL